MKPINQRCCISCRRPGPKTDFLRIVRSAGTGEILLDQGMGRSAYICRNQSCLSLAQKKKKLGRSLRIAIAPEIYQALVKRLSDDGVR